MYKLGPVENNRLSENVSQCPTRNDFTGHNLNTSPCSLRSPTSENTSKPSTTSVLRRWRKPEAQDSSTKHVSQQESPNQPSKCVKFSSPPSYPDKQMNPNSSYPKNDYSAYVPQLSPLVPQSTARPYETPKYLTHAQYSAQNKIGADKNNAATVQNSYFHQDSTNQDVHFRSPNYPIQNTPPLAHSSSQKCIIPSNENNLYSGSNQKLSRDFNYQNYASKSPQDNRLNRDYSLAAQSYSSQKLNQADSKVSATQGVTEDSNYCLTKTAGYGQDNRNSPQNITPGYPLQNPLDRRVSPHNSKSPVYRNYPAQNSIPNVPAQNFVFSTKNTADYMNQNNNYFIDKSPCFLQDSRLQNKPIIDNKYIQNYNQNYNVAKNQIINTSDPKNYRNVIPSKKSPPFPILEQRLNQAESSYCSDYSTQAYYNKYGPVMLSRTSSSPKIPRNASVVQHNYIPQKMSGQELMVAPNYSIQNKFYQQNQTQDWKMPKEYEQNMYLSQMNQMHARLPHNTINKPNEIRDISYMEQSQRLVQKARTFFPETSVVDHLQYTGKTIVPQKSPKAVGYNLPDQKQTEHPPNDYLNMSRSCATVMKPTEYQRIAKVGEYSPVIQSAKGAEMTYDPKFSREYLMHQQAYRNDISNDQQNYICSPPLISQNSRKPAYPIGYPRSTNVKINEIPRNISPRRTFQENMPVMVFSPQHIGLPKTSPSQMFPPDHSQHYSGYGSRDSVYPGMKTISQYSLDQPGKYQHLQINRNIQQQRMHLAYPEHHYYQPKTLEISDKPNYYQENMYRTHYNQNFTEYVQQNSCREFQTSYRNTTDFNVIEKSIEVDENSFPKKYSDGKSLKEFLESWEDDEEIVSNLPDLVLCNNITAEKQKLPFADISTQDTSETSLSKLSSKDDTSNEKAVGLTSEQPLYILDSTNISTEALPQYLAVYEQVDKLPDNIKGFYKEVTEHGEESSIKISEITEKSSVISTDFESRKNISSKTSSPEDLSLSKNKPEETAQEDDQQVLNLSTNRNQTNDEFLVEEYSNHSISDNSEIETVVPDTNFSETEKSLEQDESGETNENVQKKSEDGEKSPEGNNEATQCYQSEGQKLKDGQECVIIIPLEEKNRNDDNSEDDNYPSWIASDSDAKIDENCEEKQDEEIIEITSEKPVNITTSVIVPNTYFDSSTFSRNDSIDKPTENSNKNEDILKTGVEEVKENKISNEDEPDILPLLNSNENKNNGTSAIESHIGNLLEKTDSIEIQTNNHKFDNKQIDLENSDLDDTEHNKEKKELEPMCLDILINSPESIEIKDSDISLKFEEDIGNIDKNIKEKEKTIDSQSEVAEILSEECSSEIKDITICSTIGETLLNGDNNDDNKEENVEMPMNNEITNEKIEESCLILEPSLQNLPDFDENFTESAVDKLIITNVKTIKEESSDGSYCEEIKSPMSLAEVKIEDEINIFDEPVLLKFDAEVETNNIQVKEYSHLIEIDSSDHILEENISFEDKFKEECKSEEKENFDFSYLESCTENICKDSSDKTINCNITTDQNTNCVEECNTETLEFILKSSEIETNFDNKATCSDNLNNILTNKFEENRKQDNSLMDENLSVKVEEKLKIEKKIEVITSSVVEVPKQNLVPLLEINVPQPRDINHEISKTSEISNLNEEITKETIISSEIQIKELSTEQAENFIENSVPLEEKINLSTNEDIVIPEDSECVVIYGENEEILIFQPNDDSTEIIPSNLIIEETEVIIPDPFLEQEQANQEIIVEKEETVGQEIIICGNEFEDWVQNEEIVETKLEHFDNEGKYEKEETEVKDEFLCVKIYTEAFINEERKYDCSDSDLKRIVEEKELFINPENPETVKLNKISNNHNFITQSTSRKRRMSYSDFSSPKIDFKAPKRRYSSMESNRSMKKPLINLDEISENITEVLKNLAKQENIHYQLNKSTDEDKLFDSKSLKTEEIKEESKSLKTEEIKGESISLKIEEIKEVSKSLKTEEIKEELKLNLEIEEENFVDKSLKENICSNIISSTKTDENIKTKISTEKIKELETIKPTVDSKNFDFNISQEVKSNFSHNLQNSICKSNLESKLNISSPVHNTARLTEPIFPKSLITDTQVTIKRLNVDPRIEQSKEILENNEKPSSFTNKLSNTTFGLTEYTKNYIKMKTGQSIDSKNVSVLNGSKILESSTIRNESLPNEANEVQPSANIVFKNNEKKVKINLQDYRNRKLSQNSADSNVSTIENCFNGDNQKYIPANLEMFDEERVDRKVEKLIIKPKKSLVMSTKDSNLLSGVLDDSTNLKIPNSSNKNSNKVDCKKPENNKTILTNKSIFDLKQAPKKRKKRFRNLYTIDEEDEPSTKQTKSTLGVPKIQTNGILEIADDSSAKTSEDSLTGELSSGTSRDFLCLDLNSNGTTEHNCEFKCNIKLDSLTTNIRDYEINKSASANSNLKLTLKPVKKSKPAFSEVLSNLDSLVENNLVTKRHKTRLSIVNSVKNGDGSLWTIKNKVPKVIIKKSGSGYCAVFTDVSSNPIWQPKIRLKRQKYIESLVVRSNVNI